MHKEVISSKISQKVRNNVTLDVRQVILDVTLPKRWFDNVMLNSHENILSFSGVRQVTRKAWTVLCAHYMHSPDILQQV